MRWIGIRHRVKATKDGEARPTQLSVLNEDGSTGSLELATETDELDWVLGRLPTSFRPVQESDDLTGFCSHHVKWRDLRDNEKPEMFPEKFRRKEDKVWQAAARVPAGFTGLQKDDNVAMILGGSGDRLAFAISRNGEKIGAKAFRIPAFRFKDHRQDENKDVDAALLADLLKKEPASFYPVDPRDRKTIWLTECFRARMDAMEQRIKCEQRIFASLTGRVFCSPDGLYPEGSIEDQFNAAKASDAILQALVKEENRRDRELSDAVEGTDVYQKIFSKVVGCGPAIVSRMIAGIQTIRRFETDSKFKAFCGVHVLLDGRFPRKRKGEVANWEDDVRQGFYLLVDQFNRRKDSPWRARLDEYKAKLRAKHPQETGGNGKKKYSNGHIHKMALWRVATKFAEWLFKEWWKLEEQPH